jgi:hypothetical protein
MGHALRSTSKQQRYASVVVEIASIRASDALGNRVVEALLRTRATIA